MSTATLQAPPSPRTERLRGLAAAQHRMRTATGPDAYRDAAADRNALEQQLAPITDEECRSIDACLAYLKRVDVAEVTT